MAFSLLTLNLLTWRIWWAPNNAIKWQMGFNSAFSLLTKRNQVPGHLNTSLDIYRPLTFLYNKIQIIVPLCQIPCLLYFRHYYMSKQHFSENRGIIFYHFTNPMSSPIQLNISSLSLQHISLEELLKRMLSKILKERIHKPYSFPIRSSYKLLFISSVPTPRIIQNRNPY
jgi:hypothetical protein